MFALVFGDSCVLTGTLSIAMFGPLSWFNSIFREGGTLLNRVIGYLGRNPHMCHR